eukprot:3351328-Rhodomonas_salina.1
MRAASAWMLAAAMTAIKDTREHTHAAAMTAINETRKPREETRAWRSEQPRAVSNAAGRTPSCFSFLSGLPSAPSSLRLRFAAIEGTTAAQKQQQQQHQNEIRNRRTA